MYYLIAVIVALLAGAVTGYYCRRKRISRVQSIAMVLLAVYTFLVFASTVFSRAPMSSYRYELMPFWSYREILAGSKSLFWEDVLNVILLLPMGILLPAAMGGDGGGKRFRRVVLSGFLTSFAIEVLQLILKRGLFEFDDMFHNVIGVAVGYWIYRKLRKVYRTR